MKHQGLGKELIKRWSVWEDVETFTSCDETKVDDTNHNETHDAVKDLMEEILNRVENCSLPYNIHSEAKGVKLPHSRWGLHQDEGVTIFCHLREKEIDKLVMFNDNKPQVTLNGKVVDLHLETVSSASDVEGILSKVHSLRLCAGAGPTQFSAVCDRYLKQEINIHYKKPSERCPPCKKLRENLVRKQRRACERKKRVQSKMKPTARIGQQKRRLRKKVEHLEKSVAEIKEEYKNVEMEKLEEMVKHLPLTQQELIRACLKAGKAKGPQGLRYTNDWAFECVLMRIKGPKLYRSIRKQRLMPLPSVNTLQRYMRKLQPDWGFQKGIFELMSKKGEHMSEEEKHGSLLFDEIKLSTMAKFNKNSLLVDGLVFLGDETPEEQKRQLGDHALVFMYQPFRGSWIQVIAPFLSRGAAKGAVLEKLTIEVIVHLNNAGFHVDEIVSDGGAWNRNMWKLFGVSDTKCSCPHPVDPQNRRLWFASDFPHLMKTMWSRVRKQLVLETPDGRVQFYYWEQLVKDDEKRHIKRNAFLTKSHCYPKHFQTMNVKMAFTFFSGKVARVLKYHLDKGDPGYKGCEATIQFINRINNLSDAMNSFRPSQALRPGAGTTANDAIVEFVNFLKEWQEKVPSSDRRLTHQTHLGLVVTLKGSLELVQYLSDKVGYEYLMTRRLNQDALEHFFGNIRQACGANSHPDPTQFIQLYRLLSLHSLVKPPRGSNVTGGEMVTALLTLDDTVNRAHLQRRIELETRFDEVLDDGGFDHLEPFFEEKPSRVDIDPPALTNFTGYVARKAKRWSIANKCEGCLVSLLAPTNRQHDTDEDLIQYRSHGYLFVPSSSLMNIVYRLESCILNILEREKLHRNIIFDVVDEVKEVGIPTKVGCEDEEHQHMLTKWILGFYLRTRLIFACRREIEQLAEEAHKKKKQLSKASKLT